MRQTFLRRDFSLAGIALAAGFGLAALSGPARAEEYDPWPGIAKEQFAGRAIAEDGAVSLEAPVRAEDAALVPLTIRVPAGAKAKSITLVVDKNPAPVVATFTFGPAAGEGERMISTRVRVDMYSNVRVVLETTDGQLHMTTKFVKAAGGCSAPALKDADDALASIGKTQVRVFDNNGGAASAPEAQVMIRHPNYSGMQMNQLTGFYIPAKYVREMEVRRGKDVVFRMEGGISISEDPNIRFTYAPGAAGDDAIEVTAKDTDGRVYTGRGGQKGA